LGALLFKTDPKVSLSLVDAQYAELGTAVNSVLSFGAVDTIGATVLQLALAEATGYEAGTVDTTAYQVIGYTLRATLRKRLVATGRTDGAGVRVDLDADVGTLAEEAKQALAEA